MDLYTTEQDGAPPRGLSRRTLLRLAAASAGALSPGRAVFADPKEIVRESAYNYIIVARDGPVVSFRRMENGAAISAIDTGRPTFQVIPYTKFLFAASLVNPNPASALSIGLGAGSLNRLFNPLYPAAILTSVEIDPMIRDLAVEFTQFQPSERNRVVIEDGRRFLRRSADKWDWIVIDAFVRNSQYPPHLATHEFFALVGDHLNEGGVLAINVISGNRLFDCLIGAIASAFKSCVLFPVPKTANVVVLASMRAQADMEAAIKSTAASPALLADNGVDLALFRAAAAPPGALSCARPLTDDFAPTEFLGAQWLK
jgi:spermidine synthase